MSAGAGAPQRDRFAPPGAILIVLAMAPVFLLGVGSLFEAWARPEYSHGPLIPLISGYLFLRQLRDDPLRGAAPGATWQGQLVCALSLLIAGFGVASRIPDIVTYGMIIWIYGLALVGFGWERGKAYWPPVVHLAFMLPLPNMIYWKLSLELQAIASELGVFFIRMMDIPVFLEGNIIDLGDLKLHVAEACSGLRYLFPILSFSYVFAILYQGSFTQKAIIFLSAAPITILLNSARIGAIGVLADRYGVAPAENFLHYFEGWLIFLVCIALILLLAYALKRIARDRRSLLEALDLDSAGVAPVALGVAAARWTKPLAAFAGMTLVAAALFHMSLTRPEIIPDRKSFDLFPSRIDAWSGSRLALDQSVEQVLGADDYLLSVFSDEAQGAPVELFVAYYERITEGAGVHSPEVCLPGGGWEIEKIEEAAAPITLGGGATSIPVNRAVIVKGERRQLVYYWFEQRGRRLTSDYKTKAWAVLESITENRSDVALVRAITPIAFGEKETEADARLQAFLGGAVDRLAAHIPE